MQKPPIFATDHRSLFCKEPCNRVKCRFSAHWRRSFTQLERFCNNRSYCTKRLRGRRHRRIRSSIRTAAVLCVRMSFRTDSKCRSISEHNGASNASLPVKKAQASRYAPVAPM